MSLLALGLALIGVALLLVFRTERSWRFQETPRVIDPDALLRRKDHVVRQTYSFMLASVFCGVVLFTGFPGVIVLVFAMFAWGVYLYVMWMYLIRSVKHLRTIDPAEYVRQQRTTDAEHNRADPSA